MRVDWDTLIISAMPTSIITLLFAPILPFYGLLTFFTLMTLISYLFTIRVKDFLSGPDPVEKIQKQYEENDMTEEELEMKLERELE